MAKIRVEIEVPNGEYCDEEPICPLLNRDIYGKVFCSIYPNSNLELDTNANMYDRCDECKQAEVEEQ